jgi:hypothetical protein
MHLGSARSLLDKDFMASRIGELPALRGQQLRTIEFAGLWVKPSQHFNVCYELVVGDEGRALRVSGFVLAPPQAARIVSSIGPHRSGIRTPSACPHCRSHLVDANILLQLFPSDYRLPTLPACLDAAPVEDASTVVSCEPLGYRPGMRCQIRYQAADGTSTYGKVAVERSPGETATLHERVFAALAHRPRRLRIAEPLRYLRHLHLALVAAAPGASLHAALGARRDLAADIHVVAQAVAEFHCLEVDGVERIYGVADEIGLVHAWVGLVAEMYPELGGGLRAGEAALVRTLPDTIAPRALVHRDLYDKQVLLSRDGVTLLDMDTVCRGDPEIDLGNFCAHLRLRGLQWEVHEPCRIWEEVFLAAYPGRVAAERVAWYRSSSLLRLACGYALRPRWRHLAPELLTESMHP